MPECICCGIPLSRNDVGATKKLVNRGAEEFLCIPCLAVKFKVDVALIEKKIGEWREQGCMLFD